MKLKLQICLVAVFLFVSAITLNAQIKITEAMASSGTGGTNDWIELTNYGTTAVDITGWKMDDKSYAFATAVALTGVTSIPVGGSVIFLEHDNPTTAIPVFKTFWGVSLNTVAVGSYLSAGLAVGLSSTGDGAVIYNAAGVEINRVSFGASTTGKSFYWSYKADGTVVDNAVISALGTLNDTIANQVTLTSANALANIGSPGTAVVAAISTSVNNPDYKNWTLIGNKLKFDVLPTTQVEIFALTGSKIAVYEPEKEINLTLSKGLYVLRVDNKASKIIIK
ncbi:MAG: lamin tail domain-containing protein [Paludibacter sp.]|nr:lamin tail domain-containing protein [Paludibacter sp.]